MLYGLFAEKYGWTPKQVGELTWPQISMYMRAAQFFIDGGDDDHDDSYKVFGGYMEGGRIKFGDYKDALRWEKYKADVIAAEQNEDD